MIGKGEVPVVGSLPGRESFLSPIPSPGPSVTAETMTTMMTITATIAQNFQDFQKGFPF